MAKKKDAWKSTRTESFTRGETTYNLVAGEVYDDLPEDLVEMLSGDYGGLVPDDGEEEDGG